MNCSFIAHAKVYYSGEEDLNTDDIQKQSDIFVKERLPNNIQLVLETKEVIEKKDTIVPTHPDVNGMNNNASDVSFEQKGQVGYFTFILIGAALVAFVGIAISFVLYRRRRYEEDIWERFDKGLIKTKMIQNNEVDMSFENTSLCESPSTCDLLTPVSSPLSKDTHSGNSISEENLIPDAASDGGSQFPIKTSSGAMEDFSSIIYSKQIKGRPHLSQSELDNCKKSIENYIIEIDSEDNQSRRCFNFITK